MCCTPDVEQDVIRSVFFGRMLFIQIWLLMWKPAQWNEMKKKNWNILCLKWWSAAGSFIRTHFRLAATVCGVQIGPIYFFCEQAELTATISNNGNKNTEKQTNRQWTHWNESISARPDLWQTLDVDFFLTLHMFRSSDFKNYGVFLTHKTK